MFTNRFYYSSFNSNTFNSNDSKNHALNKF